MPLRDAAHPLPEIVIHKGGYPDRSFNGEHPLLPGVDFVDGYAYTDDPAILGTARSVPGLFSVDAVVTPS